MPGSWLELIEVVSKEESLHPPILPVVDNGMERQLHGSDEWYLLPRSRTRGERDLRELARTASQEYLWLYDRRGAWLHMPCEQSREVYDDGQVLLTLHPPRVAVHFVSAPSLLYHIHPTQSIDTRVGDLQRERGWSDRIAAQVLEAILACPSRGDIINAAARTPLMPNCIVTEFGVTQYAAEEQRSPEEIRTPEGVDLDLILDVVRRTPEERILPELFAAITRKTREHLEVRYRQFQERRSRTPGYVN